MASAEELGFELLPVEDAGSTPEQDLNAAEAAALENPLAGPDEPGELIPLGRSWAFDFGRERFRKSGTGPAEVRGEGALIMWCLMAIYSARGAHDVFPASFGMDEPHSPIGLIEIGEVAGDYGQRLREALLVHDRIVAVDDYKATYSPEEGMITMSFTVITDEAESLPFGGVQVETELG